MGHSKSRTFDEIKTKLGERIRSRRKDRGLTLEQFAEVCGLSQSLMSQMENGQLDFGLTSLAAVVRGLETTVESLLDGIF